jgi:hypothetical protein
MWSFARRAIAQLHAGTYISKPTTVHMPKVFLGSGRAGGPGACEVWERMVWGDVSLL